MVRYRRRYPRARSRLFLFDLGPMVVLGLAVVVLGYLMFGDDIHINLASSEVETAPYTARSGVSFTRPANWVLKEIEGSVTVANTHHALNSIELDPGDVSVTLLPPYPPALLAESNLSMRDALLNMAASRYDPSVIGEPDETEINGRPAVRLPLNSSVFEGFAAATELSGGYVVLAFVDAAPGALAAEEAAALDIIGSVQYDPPEPTAAP